MKKVCVVTGSRAEFGLLSNLMIEIKNSALLELQTIITGSHLALEYGFTLDEIMSHGLQIDKKVEMLLSSDTSVGITKSAGLALLGFADAFEDLKPDAVVLLGDRYEIFSAAIACLIAQIPVVHIHGGELTEGAYDDTMRHCITKIADVHFVATEEYKKRVVQLGEQPEMVINVGGLGADNLSFCKLIDKNQLEKDMDFKFLERNILVTIHPETSGLEDTDSVVTATMDALSKTLNIGIIFTFPNADVGSAFIIKEIEKFCKNNANAKAFPSLGMERYFSCINVVDGVVGNSSSGLLEVPSFKKGTVNIGNRQKGRVAASSVIHCNSRSDEIFAAVEYMLSEEFTLQLAETFDPYDKPGTVKKITGFLERTTFSKKRGKNFFDVEFSF